jgi:hypothetical protein
VRAARLAHFIDLLRNEKPVYVTLDEPGTPQWGFSLNTSEEAVGEQEGLAKFITVKQHA